MASIVKANSSLTAGGLAVIKRNYNLSDEGSLTYQVEYCCLSQFANNHAGKFKTGAQPPTALPASLLLFRLDGPPKLYEISISSESGLTNFSASYSAGSQESGQYTINTSTETRNFSGTFEGETAVRNSSGDITQILRGPINISFDYQSITVSVESKSPNNIPDIKGSTGQIFNYSVSKLNGQDPEILGRTFYTEKIIESFNTTRTSRGLFTYNKTSSGIYEANESGLQLRLQIPPRPGGFIN
jgi:hypothetical protein